MTLHSFNQPEYVTLSALVFFASLLVVFYTYIGYPLFLFVCSRLFPSAVRTGEHYPTVCAVVAVYNEAQIIDRKISNLLALEYPPEKLEIVVVSDGSTDETPERLTGLSDSRVRILEIPERTGKANALNQALKTTSAEIVFFTDARQTLEPESLKVLVSNFADPQVGCVSGELMLRQAHGAVGALGLYWKVEKLIRRWESISGSVIGVTGAIYAARRSLIPELPVATILDDVFIPISISKQSYRIILEPDARAWDVLAADPKREFRRKVRTLTGNYQLLLLAPWLATSANPLWWRFFSHKLMRLIVPFALAGALLANLFLVGRFFQASLALQLMFYAVGVLGWIPFRFGRLSWLSDSIRAFLTLNGAAVAAFFNFLRRNWAVWI